MFFILFTLIQLKKGLIQLKKGNDTHLFLSFTSLKRSVIGQIRNTEINMYGLGRGE